MRPSGARWEGPASRGPWPRSRLEEVSAETLRRRGKLLYSGRDLGFNLLIAPCWAAWSLCDGISAPGSPQELNGHRS